MKTNTAIPLPMDKLEAFCAKWKITELAVFGSVLRDDFRPDSDVDFLATFARDAQWSLFHLVDIKEELEVMMGRPADLVDRRGVERSKNYIRRRGILASAEIIFVAS